jgi:hypothetical protein
MKNSISEWRVNNPFSAAAGGGALAKLKFASAVDGKLTKQIWAMAGRERIRCFGGKLRVPI